MSTRPIAATITIMVEKRFMTNTNTTQMSINTGITVNRIHRRLTAIPLPVIQEFPLHQIPVAATTGIGRETNRSVLSRKAIRVARPIIFALRQHT